MLDKIIQRAVPQWEDDSYLFSFMANSLPVDDWANYFSGEELKYLLTKNYMFEHVITDPEYLEEFDRPSLRGIAKMTALPATIYTHAVERQNGYPLDTCLRDIREMLEKNPKTRRAMLRLVNPLVDYYDSTQKPGVDITCLNLLHFTHDGARMIFRASDIKNELIPDILTVNKHFIKPVYGDLPYKLTVFSSTAQNISSWSDTMKSLNSLLVLK